MGIVFRNDPDRFLDFGFNKSLGFEELDQSCLHPPRVVHDQDRTRAPEQERIVGRTQANKKE
jgi:hypothetical protein